MLIRFAIFVAIFMTLSTVGAPIPLLFSLGSDSAYLQIFATGKPKINKEDPLWFRLFSRFRPFRLWFALIHCAAKWLLGVDFEVRGLENLKNGPCLLASKHQSLWETLAIPVTLGECPAIVLKKEVLKFPVFGFIMRRAGGLPVDREKSNLRTIRDLCAKAKKAAASGRYVMIFPEGTRSLPGAETEYKPGVGFLYSALGLPCVPVAHNAGLFWPKRKLMHSEVYPGKIIIEYLKPIEAGLKRKEFQARMEKVIEEASNRLILEAAAVKEYEKNPLIKEAVKRLESRGLVKGKRNSGGEDEAPHATEKSAGESELLT